MYKGVSELGNMIELTCIIVDDEPQNQEVLEKMVEQFCPAVKVLGKAASVDEAIILINEFNPVVVFLDVEMPGGNGFTLFEKIPDPNFYVIFTTAHANYAIKAIKFAALDYLLKPINLAELKKAVEKAAQKSANSKILRESNQRQIEVLQSNKSESSFEFNKIALPTREGLEFFSVQDILRCEADRAYCVFYFTNGKRVVVSNSLKEYESILEAANFFRVHKSNIVNIEHIEKYIRGNGGHVILSDQSSVAVSVRKKAELLEVLAS